MIHINEFYTDKCKQKISHLLHPLNEIVLKYVPTITLSKKGNQLILSTPVSYTFTQ